MINQEDKYRLLSEHIESESFNSILQFRSMIEKTVEKGSIDTPEEKEIFLILGSLFLIRSQISMDEDQYLFQIDQTLKEEFLSCGDVPGGESCKTCTKVCPFKEEENEKSKMLE